MNPRLTSLVLIALLTAGGPLRACQVDSAVSAQVEVSSATPEQARALVQAASLAGARVACRDGLFQVSASSRAGLRRAVAALCRATEAAGLKTRLRSTVQAGAPDALDSRLAAKVQFQPTVRPMAPTALSGPPPVIEPAAWTCPPAVEPPRPEDTAAPGARAPRAPPA